MLILDHSFKKYFYINYHYLFYNKLDIYISNSISDIHLLNKNLFGINSISGFLLLKFKIKFCLILNL
jgi:hypothetical protein